MQVEDSKYEMLDEVIGELLLPRVECRIDYYYADFTSSILNMKMTRLSVPKEPFRLDRPSTYESDSEIRRVSFYIAKTIIF